MGKFTLGDRFQTNTTQWTLLLVQFVINWYDFCYGNLCSYFVEFFDKFQLNAHLNHNYSWQHTEFVQLNIRCLMNSIFYQSYELFVCITFISLLPIFFLSPFSLLIALKCSFNLIICPLCTTFASFW